MTQAEKWIVITTINPPTETIKAVSALCASGEWTISGASSLITQNVFPTGITRERTLVTCMPFGEVQRSFLRPTTITILSQLSALD